MSDQNVTKDSFVFLKKDNHLGQVLEPKGDDGRYKIAHLKKEKENDQDFRELNLLREEFYTVEEFQNKYGELKGYSPGIVYIKGLGLAKIRKLGILSKKHPNLRIYDVKYVYTKQTERIYPGDAHFKMKSIEQAIRDKDIKDTFKLTKDDGKPNQDAIDAILKVHDEERQQVGVPALTWSPSESLTDPKYSNLTAIAQEWAEYLVDQYKKNGTEIKHRNDVEGYQKPQLGENIYSSTSLSSIDEAVIAWAEEKQNYDETHNKKIDPNGVMIGHFTQVVSKHSYYVGTGVARWIDETTKKVKYEVIVCNYYPQGNIDQRPYDVPYKKGKVPEGETWSGTLGAGQLKYHEFNAISGMAYVQQILEKPGNVSLHFGRNMFNSTYAV